jgi:uncharacterized coiled-coil protein SlyX
VTKEKRIEALETRLSEALDAIEALKKRVRDGEAKRRKLKKRFDALEASYDYRMGTR